MCVSWGEGIAEQVGSRDGRQLATYSLTFLRTCSSTWPQEELPLLHYSYSSSYSSSSSYSYSYSYSSSSSYYPYYPYSSYSYWRTIFHSSSL